MNDITEFRGNNYYLSTISAEHGTSKTKTVTGLSKKSMKLTKEFHSGTAKRAASFCSGT